MADTMNSRLGSKRSGSPSNALNKVPTTKPPCTALVSSADSKPDKGALLAKAEAAAADANQTIMAANCATRMTVMDGHFSERPPPQAAATGDGPVGIAYFNASIVPLDGCSQGAARA